MYTIEDQWKLHRQLRIHNIKDCILLSNRDHRVHSKHVPQKVWSWLSRIRVSQAEETKFCIQVAIQKLRKQLTSRLAQKQARDWQQICNKVMIDDPTTS